MEEDNEYEFSGVLENEISSDDDMSNMPYGINSAIYLYMTHGPYLVIVGSCSNLMKDDNGYKLFRMFEDGISSDVDMSNMPCRLNSAPTPL